jgi:prepilin-type N-terminal cleavage/methylation domain-containing protein
MRPHIVRSRGVRLRLRAAAFTLVEVIVALAVVLILAAVALPALNGFVDQKSVETAATQLATVRDAIYGTADGFEKTVGAIPGRLSHLTTPIVKSNPSYLNSCDVQYTNKQQNNWDGPYVNFMIDASTGMATAIGVAADTVTRNPTTATAGTLRINFVNNVEQRNAQLLDDYVDASNGSGTGTVQWSAPNADGQVTLYYYFPINATC